MILYTPGIFKYENTNYYLSIPSVVGKSLDLKSNSVLMVSTDCINFNILTKNLFKTNNDNKTSMNINSIVPSHDNKKMYIYSHHNTIENEYISCHSFEKDRIQKIVCNDYGSIKTNLIELHNKLYINYDTFNNGYIEIQIKDVNNTIILDTIKFYNSSYNLEIKWNNNYTMTNGNYHIKFKMYNCILYSFSYD